MTKKSSDVIIEFLYRLLYAGILSSAMLLCFPDLCGITSVNGKHMIVLLTVNIFLTVAWLLDRRQQIFMLALGILALIAFILFADEGPFLFSLIAIGFSLQILIGKNIFWKAVLSFVAGGWLFYVLFWKQQVSKMGIFCFVIYILLTMIEWIRANRKKAKSENCHAFVLGITPFLIIYFGFLSFMPMADTPYSWQWMKDIYWNVEEKMTMYVENLRNWGQEDFSFVTTGFSEEGALFSNVRRDDKQLMILKMRNTRDMPVYLAGKVFASFNGREWEGQCKSSELERFFDVAETIYALERYEGDGESNYYKNIQMEVEYQYFHSNYLFAPLKTWKIEGNGKSIKYHQDGTDLVFDRKAGYGTGYLLKFCQINMKQEELCRFLELNKNEDEEVWRKVVQQYSEESISIEDFYAYREKIKEQYLPETNVSSNVEEWLLNVTANAATDVEKLSCIENALASMKYNTNPGKLPEAVTDEKSFLDYVIVEKQEGYCAHFATAFVLLARKEGFPARYVQGFCVPAVNGKETAVYSYMAHAWPEVYLEGKGWISFEPTPGYGVNRYILWEENADSETGIANSRSNISRAQEDMSIEMVPEEEILKKGTVEAAEQNSWLMHLGKIVFILAVGSTLIFTIDWIGEKHREKRRSLSEKYRIVVLQNLKILSMLGFGREPSETYHELVKRIRQNDTDENLYEFIENYEKLLYGTLKVNEQILKNALDERAELFIKLKKYKGKKYLLCRMRLYIMRER